MGPSRQAGRYILPSGRDVVRTRPQTGYLYRAVDKKGKPICSHFESVRDIPAAMAFFRKARAAVAPRWPKKVSLNARKPNHFGLRWLRREDFRWKYVLDRKGRYLNSIVEQDHRAIKSRCRSMLGFKSYQTAAVTLAGIDLVHRIRQGQFKFGPGRWRNIGIQLWHELQKQ